MGSLLSALLNLQSIERQLAQVRTRLRARLNAVNAQQKRIDTRQEELESLNQQLQDSRKAADEHELTLRSKQEEVTKYRTALNAAKSNKEYAAILTQINTLKADNAKLEEEILKLMQQVDAAKEQAQAAQQGIKEEQEKLEGVQASSQEEIDKLNAMVEDLEAKRKEATEGIDAKALQSFERIADTYQGEAMAPVEAQGKKPPYTYVCGGCFMALNPEHANALRVRDEIRHCDNCGRILYLEEQGQQA
jgi:hypothetical protein